MCVFRFGCLEFEKGFRIGGHSDVEFVPLGGNSRTDVVGCDQGFWFCVGRRDSGGGDWFAVLDAIRDGVVEVEELGQEVGLGGEAVGGEDGGVERGVSVFQGIRAGQLQRAIHRAQAAGDLRERLGTHATHLTTRLRHRLDLLRTRRLRPRERVED